MAGVSVKVDLRGVESKLSKKEFNAGRYAMANQMLSDMDKFIPLRDGDLRATGMIGANGKNLMWNTVYARAQFYGTNGIAVFRRYTTLGTGKRWDEVASAIYVNEWIRTFVKGANLV